MYYRGRNGYGHLTGIQITKYNGYVCIYPTNTKGSSSSCYLEIPVGDIPDVIQALIEVHKDAELHRSQS